jgi:pimeloyl-ACP methyl ester carboxylesterase
VIEARPVQDRVRVEAGVALRTLSWGEPRSDHPSLLLVHGLASNAHLWDGVGAALVERSHHAVAVDLRGHGLSDRPDHGYNFDRVVKDLNLVIEHHGLDRPLVVGQSWGGNLVVELGWAHPHAVSGVVAVDGGLIELGERFPNWEDCARILRPPLLAGTPLAEFESRVRAMHADWPESGIRGVLACFEVDDQQRIHPRLSLERHLMILRSLWEHRPFSRFSEITRAVMFVLADSGDVAWTANKELAAERALGELQRGRVEWFRPAHHDVHAQYPEALTDVLLATWAEGFFDG